MATRSCSLGLPGISILPLPPSLPGISILPRSPCLGYRSYLHCQTIPFQTHQSDKPPAPCQTPKSTCQVEFSSLVFKSTVKIGEPTGSSSGAGCHEVFAGSTSGKSQRSQLASFPGVFFCWCSYSLKMLSRAFSLRVARANRPLSMASDCQEA